MAQGFSQGDRVEWNTPQGKTRGTVKKKLMTQVLRNHCLLLDIHSLAQTTRSRKSVFSILHVPVRAVRKEG